MQVKRIERKKKHLIYALKYIDKKKCIEKHATLNIFRERMVLQSLKHPYVVNLQYAFQDDDNLFMVLDLAEGGDLRCHLDRMKGMKDDSLTVYAAEIAYALDYLHENLIIHRDLKPENLLLDRDGHITITDFNVCSNLKDSKPSSPSGTRPYMAPEMFLGKSYSYSVDWWALGIVLYECTYGKVDKDWTPTHFESVPLVFPDSFYKCENTKIVSCPSRDLFYRGLLNMDKKARLGSSNNGLGFQLDIMGEAWLKHIDWDLVKEKKLQPPYRPNIKALNIDSALLIDEIIGGGDGLAYKARRNDSDRRPSLSEKITNGFKKIFGIKIKEPEVIDPNAPPPVLTREQQDMADMDLYYTNYNHELPDQLPMVLPAKVKKEKVAKDVAAADAGLPPISGGEKALPILVTIPKDGDNASVHAEDSSRKSSSIQSLAAESTPKLMVLTRLEKIVEASILSAAPFVPTPAKTALIEDAIAEIGSIDQIPAPATVPEIAAPIVADLETAVHVKSVVPVDAPAKIELADAGIASLPVEVVPTIAVATVNPSILKSEAVIVNSEDNTPLNSAGQEVRNSKLELDGHVLITSSISVSSLNDAHKVEDISRRNSGARLSKTKPAEGDVPRSSAMVTVVAPSVDPLSTEPLSSIAMLI